MSLAQGHTRVSSGRHVRATGSKISQPPAVGFPPRARLPGPEAGVAAAPMAPPAPVVRPDPPAPPAGGRARPTSGRCRAPLPVSARPRLCRRSRRRRSRHRDAVSVPLRVAGIQPLAVRFPEGTVRSGQAGAREEPARGRRRAWGRGSGRGAAGWPGQAPRAPGRGGRGLGGPWPPAPSRQSCGAPRRPGSRGTPPSAPGLRRPEPRPPGREAKLERRWRGVPRRKARARPLPSFKVSGRPSCWEVEVFGRLGVLTESPGCCMFLLESRHSPVTSTWSALSLYLMKKKKKLFLSSFRLG